MARSVDATPAEPHYRHVVSYDAADHANAFKRWNHEYRQLVPGPFTGHLREACLYGIHVQREQLNKPAEQIGTSASGLLTFATLRPGSAVCYLDATPLSPDAIFIGGAREIRAITTGQSDTLVVSLPEILAEEYFGITALAAWKHSYARQAIWLPGRAALAELNVIGCQILDRFECCPDIASRLALCSGALEDLLDCLSSILEKRSDCDVVSQKSSTRSYILGQARQYIRDHEDESVTVSDICKALRISRRTLQYSFESILGISPVRYLLAVRLSGVRKEMRAATGRVLLQNVAADWGFWHMGRFSRQYKAFFGELPSQTLQHGRARPSFLKKESYSSLSP
jgi:AraC family ethanolamine operon transcriptional activator